MKNNEPLNSSDIHGHTDADNIGMTAEEYRLYREILDSAYPKPKRDIKGAVMSAIRAESSSDDAVILTPVKKKKTWQKAAVKWGSLAASVAIVALVGIKVLPAYISKDSIAFDSADQEAKIYATSSPETGAEAEVTYDSAPAETGAGESTVDSLYKSAYNYSKSADNSAAIAEEEAEYMDHDGAETVPETAAAKAMAEDAAEAVTEEAMPEAESIFAYTTAAYGDASKNAASNSVVTPVISCTHTEVFRDSYHEIPSFLINEVGEAEYYAWANEVSAENSCEVNIARFIKDFGISETKFTMYLTTSDIAYYCDYPLDILCGEDEAAVEEYYENGGRYGEMVKDYFEYKLKLALVSEIGTAAYTEWLDTIGCFTVRGWSISQMVTDNGIDEAEFLEIYGETVENFPEEYDGYDLPEYNTAMLYTPNAAVQISLAMSDNGYAADVACRK